MQLLLQRHSLLQNRVSHLQETKKASLLQQEDETNHNATYIKTVMATQ